MKPFPDSLMCPDCNGYGKVIKTAENAWQPGPRGMIQDCQRCNGTGSPYTARMRPIEVKP